MISSSNRLQPLHIRPLVAADLDAALRVDHSALGGLWSLEGYRRELDSPNSDLLGIWVPRGNPSALGAESCSGAESNLGAESSSGTESNLGAESSSGAESNLGAESSSGAESPHLGSHLVGIGCAWAILDEYHITLLAIAPDWQRQGLGRALLLALLIAARDRQMARATLEVRVSNDAARSLYGEFGFREAGIRKKYYAATGEDAAILWRSGLDDPRQRDQWAAWGQHTRDRLQQSGWDWSGWDWSPAIAPT